MARAVSYKTVDVLAMFKNITNHFIPGLAHAALKHLASFSNTGQFIAHIYIYVQGNRIPEMLGKSTFCCLFSDVKDLHQNIPSGDEDPESFIGSCPLKRFKFIVKFLFYPLSKPSKLRS